MTDIDEKTSRFECGSEGSLNEDSGGCGARGDCHGESSCGESSGSGVCENSCANESEESSLAVVAEGGCGACENGCQHKPECFRPDGSAISSYPSTTDENETSDEQ